LGSELPTGFGNGSLLPADDNFFNNIFGSPAMLLQDAALNHFKPTLGEALPHCPQASLAPLVATADELLIGEESGCESSWDLDVALFV
jgi:hypothetical protein